MGFHSVMLRLGSCQNQILDYEGRQTQILSGVLSPRIPRFQIHWLRNPGASMQLYSRMSPGRSHSSF